MREILFRGKRITDGKFVEGMPVANSAGEIYAIMKFNSEIEVLEIGSEVEQYTGLTDKNGKKIFEGDIVKFKDEIYVVKYLEKFMRFAPTNKRVLFASFNMANCEVIGNIHDNPELLKGGAEE